MIVAAKTSPGRPRRWSTVLAGPTACCSMVTGSHLLLRGTLRWLDTCSFYEGRKSRPDASGLLMLAGLVVVVVGAVLAAVWSDRSGPVIRLAAAPVAAATTGALLFQLGVTAAAPWGENLTLFGMVTAASAALVPPRTPWWAGGVVAGGAVAAAFGDVPMPGLLLAALVLGAASSAEVWRIRPASGTKHR